MREGSISEGEGEGERCKVDLSIIENGEVKIRRRVKCGVGKGLV